jgi:hypothetical protein
VGARSTVKEASQKYRCLTVENFVGYGTGMAAGGTLWSTMAPKLTWSEEQGVKYLKRALYAEGWPKGGQTDREVTEFANRERSGTRLLDILPRSPRPGAVDRMRQAVAAAWMVGARRRATEKRREFYEKIKRANDLTTYKQSKTEREGLEKEVRLFWRNFSWDDHPEEKKAWDRASSPENPDAKAVIAASLTRDLAPDYPRTILGKHGEFLPSVRLLHQSIWDLHRELPTQPINTGQKPRSVLSPIAEAVEAEYLDESPATRTQVVMRLIEKYFPDEDMPAEQISRGMRTRRSDFKRQAQSPP